MGEFLSVVNNKEALVHDLGANNGHFSRIACKLGYQTIAWDIDPVAVEKNYEVLKQEKRTDLLPLLLDLTNPSGAIGWSSAERDSFMQRAQNDIVLALALVHHLAISNNVPLLMIADFMAGLAQHLLIEFIPKSDSQVRRLLANRTDIFSDYTEEGFESAFSSVFEIAKRETIQGSERSLYLMRRRKGSRKD